MNAWESLAFLGEGFFARDALAAGHITSTLLKLVLSVLAGILHFGIIYRCIQISPPNTSLLSDPSRLPVREIYSDIVMVRLSSCVSMRDLLYSGGQMRNKGGQYAPLPRYRASVAAGVKLL